jgi:hypothetical protein
MFGLFKKDPLKKLQAEYSRLRVKARDLQRNGDIKGFAAVSFEAEEICRRIEVMEKELADSASG